MGTIVAAVVVLTLSPAVAVGGFLLVDQLIPTEARRRQNDVSGSMYQFVGTLYAILLAFVVFVVWGSFQEARTAAASEATALYAINNVSKGFGPAEAARIQQRALAFGESVIRDEWPVLGEGKRSQATRDALLSLSDTIESITPENSHDSNLQQLALSEVHDVSVARNLRILKAQEEIHPILWIGLIVGGVLSIAYAYMFGLEDRIAHSILISVLTVAIVGILFMIKAIDRPYSGDVRVTPDAMQETVAIIQSGR